VVLEVAIQHPVKPCTNHRHGFVPSLVERLPDRGQRGTHTLLGRQPDDLELTLSVRSTAMREPKEVERIRSALPLLAPPLSRIAAKLNQARLVRMQRQPELGEPFPECFQKRSRRPIRLEAHYTIVSVAEHNDLASP